jgi:membrane protein DedA with SNARE-associated domain
MFDWIAGFVEQSGYAGIALLMFAENLFPPIPSELIMPLAGFIAAQGKLGLALVILSGTAGSLAGALFWYAIGHRVGCERLRRSAARHGRLLTLSPKDVDRAQCWFHRHGGKAVLIGRLIPAIRTLISVPAGIAQMRLLPFLIYSMVGTAFWTTLLATTGYLLESRYQAVAAYVNPASNIVLGLIALWYLYRVVTWRRPEESTRA